MKTTAITVRDLSKKFSYKLRDSLKFGLIDSARRVVGKKSIGSQLRDGEFLALRDINFDVESGECLAVMGVNGSGKTTLLRILNGTFRPDRGEVTMRGSIGALIAAGAGFSPMLTGRENIHVNGTLLGMSSSQIKKRLEEIIHFADLEDFIDMPVRNYSSGMTVRLGFAIATVSHPEILLIDEVLAVGDLNFQKKCFEYLLKLKNEGCAMLLVSHAMGSVWAVADTGLFLENGHQIYHGTAEQACRLYDNANSRAARLSGDKSDYGNERGGSGEISCESLLMFTLEGKEVNEIEFRQPFYLEYRIKVNQPIVGPIFRSSFDAIHYKFIISIDNIEQGFPVDKVEPGTYILRKYCNNQSFRPGTYKVNTSITHRHLGTHLFFWLGALSFTVLTPNDKFFLCEPTFSMAYRC